MTNELATNNVIESVVIGGDLSKLSPEQRVQYYMRVCGSLGLNPLTRPFDYITLNGKLTLYARKDAADQLRKLHDVSIDDVDIKETDNQYIVKVKGHDRSGRSDVELGVVNKSDMRGDLANAMMKGVTKAKRRLTLSICGLVMLDETEVTTIPDARPVLVDDETGEIVNSKAPELLPVPHSLMTNEMATTMKNKDGVAYGDLDSEKLTYMANTLQKTMKANGLSPEKREEAQMKLDACLTILQDRAGKE